MKTFLRVLATLCCFLLGMTFVGGQPGPARPPASIEQQRPRVVPVQARASRDEDDEEEDEDEDRRPAKGDVSAANDPATRDASAISTVPPRNPVRPDKAAQLAPGEVPGVPLAPSPGPRVEQRQTDANDDDDDDRPRAGRPASIATDIDPAARNTAPIATIPPRNLERPDRAAQLAPGEIRGVPLAPSRGPRVEDSRTADADEGDEADRDHDEDDEEEKKPPQQQAGTDPAAGDAGSPPPVPEKAPPVSKRNPRMASEPLGPPPPPETWSPAEIAAAQAVCGRVIAEPKFEFRTLDPIREGACGAPAPISLSALTMEVEREKVKEVVAPPAEQPKNDKEIEPKDKAEKPQEAKAEVKVIREVVKEELEVELQPAVTSTCPLAAAVERWTREVVQPKAKEHLKDEVVGLVNVAAYHCRTRYNNPGERLSYHAFADAIDISGFRTAKGEQISVEQHWEGAEGKSRFLQEVHAGACRIFGTVLGPRANAAHRNHFHLDMAKRRFSAYCQ